MQEMNHECYVSLEVAKLLKQVGFDLECMCYYSVNTLHEPNNGFIHIYKQYSALFYDHNRTKMPVYSAPTLEVAQKWLREVKRHDVFVFPCNGLYFYTVRKYYNEGKVDYFDYPNKDAFDTYEEALEAGIKKALELILKK